MTDTFAPPADSLTDMIGNVLRRSTAETFGSGPAAPQSSFGAADSVEEEMASPSSGLGEEMFQPSAFGRLFASKYGSEAASRIGNESRTLSAINHLGSELIAESLRQSGQLLPDDRVLLSAVTPVPGQDEQPVVVVLTEREPDELGALQSNNVRLPPDLLSGVLQRIGAEALSVRSGRVESPEAAVLDQALKSQVPVLELMSIARPEVIYFPRPEMVDLCAPIPGLRIENGNEVSTSGILCRDADGRLGLTACYHGTGPEGTKLIIDGAEYEVALANPVQDLVFIPVGDDFLQHPQRCRAGLRQKDDLAPARDEQFNFDGIVNANMDTFAQSCDPWLFNPDPIAQIRMQTTRDTDQGDSGSALIDRNDKLAGFAFRMTGYGVRPGFTDWIWAPNALEALGLTPV